MSGAVRYTIRGPIVERLTSCGILQLDKMAEAMLDLDERSQDILQQRWIADEKATLHELAAKYNVSAERIRQLEKSAMEKLKKGIEI